MSGLGGEPLFMYSINGSSALVGTTWHGASHLNARLWPPAGVHYQLNQLLESSRWCIHVHLVSGFGKTSFPRLREKKQNNGRDRVEKTPRKPEQVLCHHLPALALAASFFVLYKFSFQENNFVAKCLACGLRLLSSTDRAADVLSELGLLQGAGAVGVHKDATRETREDAKHVHLWRHSHHGAVNCYDAASSPCLPYRTPLPIPGY